MRETYIELYRGLFERKNLIFSKNNIFEIKKYIKTFCPDCKLDPIKKESTNPGCPTCGGSGYIIDTKKVRIPMKNLNKGIETGQMNEAGVYSNDFCSVLIDYIDYSRNRKYLQEKNTVYINNEPYQIISVRDIGIASSLMIKIECNKIVEPVEGVE